MAGQVARGPLGRGATAEPVRAGDAPPAHGPRRAGGGLAQGGDPVVRGDGVTPRRRSGPRGLPGGLDDHSDLPPRGRILVREITGFAGTRPLEANRGVDLQAVLEIRTGWRRVADRSSPETPGDMRGSWIARPH